MGRKRTSRKRFYNAPLHQRKKFLRARLSEELRKKLGRKTKTVKKGDKVKILRGDFKGKTGVVASVDYKKLRITVEGISRRNSRGIEVPIPIHPSNVMIIETKLEEEKR